MMIKYYLFLPLFLITTATSTALAQQAGYLSSRNIKKNEIVKPTAATQTGKAAKPKMCFPLAEDDVYGLFDYVIDLRNEKIQHKYATLFRKHGYAFSGYVWEDILALILEDADKDISQNIVLRAEAELVCITVIRPETHTLFREYICRYLGNLQALEAQLKNADRSKVSEY